MTIITDLQGEKGRKSWFRLLQKGLKLWVLTMPYVIYVTIVFFFACHTT